MIKNFVAYLGLVSGVLFTPASLASEIILQNKAPSVCSLSGSSEGEQISNCNSVTVTESSPNNSLTVEYKFEDSDMIYTTDNTYYDITYYEGQPFYLYSIKKAVLRTNTLFESANDVNGYCGISENWDVIICLPDANSFFSNLYIR